jgi:hypothetical protein
MIVAPRLLPDEWAIGYWGRVLLLNGLDGDASAKDKQDFGRQLCRERGIDLRSGERDLEVISRVAQISVAQLLRGHTLVPFNRAVSGAVDGDWLDDQHPFRLRSSGITMGHRTGFGALCPRCVEEDRVFWGFSYWRRSHQVHGIVFCEKHGCALRRANKGLISQPLPDQESVRPLAREEYELARDAAENPWVRRYAEVSVELLNRQRPLSRLHLLHALAKRARDAGVGLDSELALSDLAERRLPADWMKRFATPSVLNDVLVRFNCTATTSDYALAMVLLYESTDEAFRDVERPLPTLTSLSRKIHDAVDRCRPPQPWTRKEVGVRRRRLTAAVDSLLGGREIRECARQASSYPIVFEDFVVQLFAGFKRRVPESAASTRATLPGQAAKIIASPHTV